MFLDFIPYLKTSKLKVFFLTKLNARGNVDTWQIPSTSRKITVVNVVQKTSYDEIQTGFLEFFKVDSKQYKIRSYSLAKLGFQSAP